jgi:hypothetical protein
MAQISLQNFGPRFSLNPIPELEPNCTKIYLHHWINLTYLYHSIKPYCRPNHLVNWVNSQLGWAPPKHINHASNLGY